MWALAVENIQPGFLLLCVAPVPTGPTVLASPEHGSLPWKSWKQENKATSITKQSYRGDAVHREGLTQSQDPENSSELKAEVQRLRLPTMAVQGAGGRV